MKEGENGSLRNAAMSAFEEGAPFMGAALAEHKQCPMAWLFLQENVQVQYLQKIALRAEN